MTFPIEEKPEWNIRDSSKLDDYLRCKRYYFYSHILGWRPELPAQDLHFGESWHKAREYQLIHGYDDIAGANEAFITHYRKEFHQDTDSLYIPKTPTAVVKALMKFREQYHRDLIDNEVVEIDGRKMTEISGTVPVGENRILHYRMDSIMRRLEDNMIFSWDHKTTSERWITGNSWADQFFLGIQNGTYTHCLYCIFPIEQVLGIEFCGVGFVYLKRGSANRPAGYDCTLRRVPAYKTPDQMNAWLWLVNDLLSDLDMETERMFECKEEDKVFMAFPMNPKSCTDYRGCQFHDYCLAWANPLQYCYEPPSGFREEFWDPSKIETSNRRDLKWQR